MIAKPSIFYPHRRNQDGSYTPICLKCLAQVARADTEGELGTHDDLHECNAARLAERFFVEPPHLFPTNEAKWPSTAGQFFTRNESLTDHIALGTYLNYRISRERIALRFHVCLHRRREILYFSDDTICRSSIIHSVLPN
jgi:hypothetical protein